MNGVHRGRVGFSRILAGGVCVGLAGLAAVAAAAPADDYYTEPKVYNMRPRPDRERNFGAIGVTGIKARLYPVMRLTVEAVEPGTPAAGLFKKGEIITGVNGTALKGRNPFVVLGSALTTAEAADGRLVFDVESADGKTARKATVEIPVLGAYSKTWPLDCAKSDRIVREAAAYYARTTRYPDGSADEHPSMYITHGIGGALACLFLLSTGDDQYLPRVKSYVDELAADPEQLGDNTWHNGYNGILVAEYYLRTGDAAALPVLRYYARNAKERLSWGVGWQHWGRSINPGYVNGGLMNPAAAQVMTSLLLARDCGVDVDETMIEGCLRFWYRFVGHGTIPYGDHRGEGGLGSNGKDGMVAAMMQVASDAQDADPVYAKARNYLGMSTLTSYPSMVTGHADNGRGDGIWRGIASALVRDVTPADYQAAMNRITWWYDLCRRPGGGLGMSGNTRFDDTGSGAGVALAYTAPRKTLRITGAPRSRYAKPFRLPPRPWGRDADVAFLSTESGKPYAEQKEKKRMPVLLHELGSAYSNPTDLSAGAPSRDDLLRLCTHKRYMVRAQAAKILMHRGDFDALEQLLNDPDPRVRRAGLDGMTDWRYWFSIGKNPIRSGDISPAMLASIHRMLTDPKEAIYVQDGALMALSCASPDTIVKNLPLVTPYATNEEWWLCQGAAKCLFKAASIPDGAKTALPVLAGMLKADNRTKFHSGALWLMEKLLKTYPAGTPEGGTILAALSRTVQQDTIIPGPRAGEGQYLVVGAAQACLKAQPATAPEIAGLVAKRLDEMAGRDLAKMVDALLASREKAPEAARKAVTERLYTDFRGYLARGVQEGETSQLGTLLKLTQLRHPDVDWQVVGTPAPAERVWRFTSFEPTGADVLRHDIGKRFRDVTWPDGMAKWYEPAFDASAWASGSAPIGKGVYTDKRGRGEIPNRSTWGKGEFLVARTTFEANPKAFDYYRLRVLSNQGYRIYLNGVPIQTYEWWKDAPEYREIGLGDEEAGQLKAGKNVLAVCVTCAYKDETPVGQIDVYLEGLRKADLLAKP